MTLNPSEKNAFVAVNNLLKIAKVKVTETTLKNKLLQHSEFPTLVSLSDVLTDLKVDNMATRINPYQLSEIPLPAIAHFENGSGYIIISKIENNTVEWLHDKMGIRSESIAEFSQKWQGITLLTQPNEKSGEENYSRNRKFEIIDNLRNPFIISGLLLILAYFIGNHFTNLSIENPNYFYAFLIAKFAGVIVSSFLIWYSIDAKNSFLTSVCEINSKTNCGNILNSEAAKILGWLTWSEIGLFYFTGGFLSLLFSNNLNETLQILKWLNVLALPYTVWSVYYQAFVAKEWCVLCLTVQVLLWIEFFTLSPISFTISSDIINSLINLSLCFLSVTILWAFIKKPLQNSGRFDETYNTLQKIKFDPDFVRGILSKERMLPPIFEGMKVLRMGNTEADNVITLALSTSCVSCGRAFQEVKKLINSNNQFRTEIFFAPSNNLSDESVRVARVILNLPNEYIQEATQKWFQNVKQDQQKWEIKLGINENIEADFQQVSFHLRWLELAGVVSAPAIFLNKAELPSFFGIANIEKLCQIAPNIGFANQK
ncbi:peptidase C39-like protein [Arcicella aurantiaca]|uniref:Peptidase C39-like protein n=1 Tax=Arcicella aurantiaca TaxID=591202 RepID=A0A316DGD7_9BACT|nr:vitamin K epoxide reductase family protein [Arcicella aurantiaca]PWK16678.1 peptidase C39-like protein [Arcicella aurantiaca]